MVGRCADGPWYVEDVGDSDIRCERLAVASRYQCGSAGFSISTTYVFTDSSRVCANPLVPW